MPTSNLLVIYKAKNGKSRKLPILSIKMTTASVQKVFGYSPYVFLIFANWFCMSNPKKLNLPTIFIKGWPEGSLRGSDANP
jgi:hypothetical protein